MNYNSFNKGEEFERFVENNLFNESEYKLVHRTNNIDQNQSRFSEDTLKPDYKFRCKNNGEEFYVEAKYRSEFNLNDRIEIMSVSQLERFKKIQQKEHIPIFIAIGYMGSPSEPQNISLIPLDDLIYLELYPSFLRKFSIGKEIVSRNSLNLRHNQHLGRDSNIDQNIANIDENNHSFTKRKRTIITTSFLSIIVIVFLSYNFFFRYTVEDDLRERTINYYRALQIGDFNELDEYINPMTERWYSKENYSLTEIKQDATSYAKKYPNTKTEIQWDSFETTPLNEDYAVSYKMIYKIFPKNDGKPKIYHLEINAIWDKDLKLKSLYEIKI